MTMKEKIEHAIQREGDTAGDRADAIVAIVAKALMSDDAIEAAAKVAYRDDGISEEWETERPTYQNMYRGRAENIIYTALRGAGVPEEVLDGI